MQGNSLYTGSYNYKTKPKAVSTWKVAAELRLPPLLVLKHKRFGEWRKFILMLSTLSLANKLHQCYFMITILKNSLKNLNRI